MKPKNTQKSNFYIIKIRNCYGDIYRTIDLWIAEDQQCLFADMHFNHEVLEVVYEREENESWTELESKLRKLEPIKTKKTKWNY